MFSKTLNNYCMCWKKKAFTKQDKWGQIWQVIYLSRQEALAIHLAFVQERHSQVEQRRRQDDTETDGENVINNGHGAPSWETEQKHLLFIYLPSHWICQSFL